MTGKRGVLLTLATAGVLVLVVAGGVWTLTPRRAAPVEGVRAREHCVDCHDAIQGIEASHAPLKLGCSPCHRGDASASDARTAHADMVLIPGNVADVEWTCGTAGCHPAMPARMRNSIMGSMNGVVSVDRWVFGEQPTPTAHTPVGSLGSSMADLHLRNLCVSCHTGTIKAAWGPIHETSRGGGCNACHLNYPPAALDELNRYTAWKTLDAATRGAFAFKAHPVLSARVSDSHCFGCHSRSGRISLNYQGWRETTLTPDDARGSDTRVLEDGRVVAKTVADVHAEKGMGCTDCHTSWEVMGEGDYTLHQEDQLRVACTDCHFTGDARTVTAEKMDPEDQRLAQIQGLWQRAREHLTLASNGKAMVNAFMEKGAAVLIKKESHQKVVMSRPTARCARSGAHRDLTCGSCHDAWAPRCVSCHTEYDRNGVMWDLLSGREYPGEWHERGGEMLAVPASLGVRTTGRGRRVEEFVPGMIMTLARTVEEKAKPILRRLYAPTAPHTIRREVRNCVSCHADPRTLGYGEGALEFHRQGKGGRWVFKASAASLKQDGLPADAWMGFLKERDASSTTRENTRPFNVPEQQRILTVGACLSCHAGDSVQMERMQADPGGTMAARKPQCAAPSWN